MPQLRGDGGLDCVSSARRGERDGRMVRYFGGRTNKIYGGLDMADKRMQGIKDDSKFQPEQSRE